MPLFGACPGAPYVIEDPGDLAPGEVGIDDQTRLLGDDWAVTFGFEPIAESGGAAILPDDGVAHRTSGSAVPDDRGFALVRDADGSDVGRTCVGAPERFDRHRALCRPDLLRVVLNPSRLRKDLLELLLRDGSDRTVMVEQDRA